MPALAAEETAGASWTGGLAAAVGWGGYVQPCIVRQLQGWRFNAWDVGGPHPAGGRMQRKCGEPEGQLGVTAGGMCAVIGPLCKHAARMVVRRRVAVASPAVESVDGGLQVQWSAGDEEWLLSTC